MANSVPCFGLRAYESLKRELANLKLIIPVCGRSRLFVRNCDDPTIFVLS
jgi:hypothetical protein